MRPTEPITITDAWTSDQMVGRSTTVIGHQLSAPGPAAIDLRSNIYLWGPRGAGTTVLTDLIISAAALHPDTLVWLIDPDGLFTARTFMTPLLAGETVRTPVDWVATDTHEAMHMLDRAAELAKLRTETDLKAHPQITIVFASGRGLFGFDGNKPADKHATSVMENLARVASYGEGTGINFVIAAKRYTPGNLSAYVRGEIDTFIALGRANPEEVGYAFGEDAAGTFDFGTGQGLVGNRDGYTDFQAFLFTRDNVQDTARMVNGLPVLDDATAEKLGTPYTYRWTRSLYILADGQPVPAHLARLGQPAAPDDLSQATSMQLAHGLREAVMDGAPQVVAAAEILIKACHGKLLTAPVMQDSRVLFAEDGRLYVRWGILAEVADSTALQRVHPDAGVMAGLAAHLATGGFTPANLEVLIDSLIIATPEEDQP